MFSFLRLTGYILACTIGFGSASGQVSDPHKALADKIVALHIIGQDESKHDVEAWGTGFIIDPNGWVLTSAHLYDDLVRYKNAVRASLKTVARIGGPAGQEINAHWKRSNDNDIALLRLEPTFKGYQSVDLMCISDLEIEESRLFTSGFYYYCDLFDKVTSSCLRPSIKYSQNAGDAGPEGWAPEDDVREINLMLADGNSGSPVYQSDGTVVGIAKGVNSSAPGKSVFVPLSWAFPLYLPIPTLVNRCVRRTSAKLNFLPSGDFATNETVSEENLKNLEAATVCSALLKSDSIPALRAFLSLMSNRKNAVSSCKASPAGSGRTRCGDLNKDQ